MSRDVQRKIAKSPNAVHALVKRDSSGSYSMTKSLSTSVTGVTANNNATVTTKLDSPKLVARTKVKAKLTTAGSSATLKVMRNGGDTTVKSLTTGATGGSLTTTVTNTHTTPLNAPTITIQGQVAGGTAKLTTASVSREQQWV